MCTCQKLSFWKKHVQQLSLDAPICMTCIQYNEYRLETWRKDATRDVSRLAVYGKNIIIFSMHDKLSEAIPVVKHIIYDFGACCHLNIAQKFRISLQVATLILPSVSIRNYSNHRIGTYFGKGTTKEIQVGIIYQSEGYCRKLYIFLSNLW